MASAEYNRNWYHANKDRIGDKKNKNAANRRLRNRHFVRGYLSMNPCVDCGETDIMVLDCDHVDRALKTQSICMAVGTGWGLSKIVEELFKCESRCANCHRRRTRIQFGWL